MYGSSLHAEVFCLLGSAELSKTLSLDSARRVRPCGAQGTWLGVQGTGKPRAPAVPPLGGAAGKFFSF